MEPLVTVIVPVYNVEKYLKKCVNSITNQTYKNLEIYLVDDGSADSCGTICDEYAKKDCRVKVVHKKNGGLSDARNVAIDVCTGEYISFIDSDDWVSEYYIENLMSAIIKTNSEIAISWFENVMEDSEPKARPQKTEKIEKLSPEQTLKKMFYQDGIETSAWGKVYKKELFEGIRYPVGKLYEDVPVTYKLIERASAISAIPNVDYYYLQRKQSIQYQKFNERKLDAIIHWETVMEHIDKTFPSLSVSVRSRYFRGICNILFQIDEDNNKYRDELWTKLQMIRKIVLKDTEGRKNTRSAAALSYLGYGVMSKIYHVTQMRG